VAETVGVAEGHAPPVRRMLSIRIVHATEFELFTMFISGMEVVPAGARSVSGIITVCHEAVTALTYLVTSQ
jgi:hypothetical protein